MRVKKNKGGLRLRAGRPYKWQAAGKTKLVRIPALYVERILQVVSYMDANEGQLPASVAFFITPPDCLLPGYKARPQLPYPRNYTDTK
ncbi:hypothetical protein [Microcoleus sp. herbarium5]|uniref:hypothetical protein n=1 Tax=Microcoleus sp. herbarium5 TaxID=3055434 RepID=UPI002FD215E1